MNALSLLTPELKELSKATVMPPQAYRVYGCYNCEFRGTGLCKYNIPIHGDFKRLGIEFDSICDDKYWYTLSMYTGDSTNPSFDALSRDYNKVSHQQLIQNVLHKIRQVRESICLYADKLKSAESPNDRSNFSEKLNNYKAQELIYEKHVLDCITDFRKLDHKDTELDQKSDSSTRQRKMTVQEMNFFIDNSQQQLKKIKAKVLE